MIPGSKISSARRNGEHFDLGKRSHTGTPCPPNSSPCFSDPQQSDGVTSGHTQLCSTAVSGIPRISLGTSPQRTQTRLQTASDLAAHSPQAPWGAQESEPPPLVAGPAAPQTEDVDALYHGPTSDIKCWCRANHSSPNKVRKTT